MSNVYVPPKRFPAYFEMIIVPNEHVEFLKIAATESSGWNEITPILSKEDVFQLPVSVFDSELWNQTQKDILITLCGGPASQNVEEIESDIFIGPFGVYSTAGLSDEAIQRLEAIQNGERPGRVVYKRFFLTQMKKSS